MKSFYKRSNLILMLITILFPLHAFADGSDCAQLYFDAMKKHDEGTRSWVIGHLDGNIHGAGVLQALGWLGAANTGVGALVEFIEVWGHVHEVKSADLKKMSDILFQVSTSQLAESWLDFYRDVQYDIRNSPETFPKLDSKNVKQLILDSVAELDTSKANAICKIKTKPGHNGDYEIVIKNNKPVVNLLTYDKFKSLVEDHMKAKLLLLEHSTEAVEGELTDTPAALKTSGLLTPFSDPALLKHRFFQDNHYMLPPISQPETQSKTEPKVVK